MIANLCIQMYRVVTKISWVHKLINVTSYSVSNDLGSILWVKWSFSLINFFTTRVTCLVSSRLLFSSTTSIDTVLQKMPDGTYFLPAFPPLLYCLNIPTSNLNRTLQCLVIPNLKWEFISCGICTIYLASSTIACQCCNLANS